MTRESGFSTVTALNVPSHIMATAMGRCPVNTQQRRTIFSKYELARRVPHPACRATRCGIARRRARQSTPGPTQQGPRPRQRTSSTSDCPLLAVPPEASDGCGFRVQSTLKSRFEPELSLFIQLMLYRLSVWATGASYGAKLQDLKYTHAVSSAGDGRVLCACNFFVSIHGAVLHSN